MINNIPISVECTTESMLVSVYTNASIFLIYVDNDVDENFFNSILQKFDISPIVNLIMTGGFRSEYFHDRIDDLLLENIYDNRLILTAWSTDSFEDLLEEFLEIHGTNINVISGRVLILANSMSRRMELLAKIASIALTGKHR